MSFLDYPSDDMRKFIDLLSYQEKRRLDIMSFQYVKHSFCHHFVRTVVECQGSDLVFAVAFAYGFQVDIARNIC
jgi:hypothetical protein